MPSATRRAISSDTSGRSRTSHETCRRHRNTASVSRAPARSSSRSSSTSAPSSTPCRRWRQCARSCSSAMAPPSSSPPPAGAQAPSQSTTPPATATRSAACNRSVALCCTAMRAGIDGSAIVVLSRSVTEVSQPSSGDSTASARPSTECSGTAGSAAAIAR